MSFFGSLSLFRKFNVLRQAEPFADATSSQEGRPISEGAQREERIWRELVDVLEASDDVPVSEGFDRDALRIAFRLAIPLIEEASVRDMKRIRAYITKRYGSNTRVKNLGEYQEDLFERGGAGSEFQAAVSNRLRYLSEYHDYTETSQFPIKTEQELMDIWELSCRLDKQLLRPSLEALAELSDARETEEGKQRWEQAFQAAREKAREIIFEDY